MAVEVGLGIAAYVAPAAIQGYKQGGAAGALQATVNKLGDAVQVVSDGVSAGIQGAVSGAKIGAALAFFKTDNAVDQASWMSWFAGNTAKGARAAMVFGGVKALKELYSQGASEAVKTVAFNAGKVLGAFGVAEALDMAGQTFQSYFG